jgi:heat shock protein HslJ
MNTPGLTMAAVLALALAGCGDLTTTGLPADDSGRAVETSAAPAHGGSGRSGESTALAGTSWKLTTVSGQDATKAPVTVSFTDTTLSGQAPVNSFTATYEAEGTSLRVGPVASTKKAGEPEAMAAEDAFFEALAKVDGYALGEGKLDLLVGDKQVLTFATAPGGGDGQGGGDGAARAEQVAGSVVGMSTEEAKAAAVAAGLQFRVISEDGKAKAATSDLRDDRINVEVEQGAVTKATVG